MAPLAPCPRCRRHVALAEPSCPFCGGGLDGLRPAPRRAGRRYVGKGATALYLTALAAGCSASTTEPAPTDASTDAASDVLGFDGFPLDGTPDTGTDTSVDTGTAPDAADADAPDEGGSFPLYK